MIASETLPVTLYQMTKLLDLSRLRAFADDNIHVTQKMKIVLERVEIRAEKEQNVFSLVSLSGSFKAGIVR